MRLAKKLSVSDVKRVSVAQEVNDVTPHNPYSHPN